MENYFLARSPGNAQGLSANHASLVERGRGRPDSAIVSPRDEVRGGIEKVPVTWWSEREKAVESSADVVNGRKGNHRRA